MAEQDLGLAPPSGLREQIGQFWRARAPRERQGLALALAVVATLLVWLIAVQPALRTLGAAPAQLDALDAQWQQMQRLAGESRDLRAAAPVQRGQAEFALRAATDRLGERAKLVLQGDRATLTLSGVTGGQLAAWLGEARSAARARAVEAQLLRGPLGYTGSVVVTLGGAP